MLVFIDESGDPGFRMDHGASPVFIAAMVIFDTAEDAIATQVAIDESKAREAHKPEFKFSKCSKEVRDLFFNAVRNCPFRVRAIVVRKDIIYSPKLKSDKDRFYEFFVKMMLSHDNGIMKGAKVIIDGSGDRTFRKNLSSALRRRVREGAIKEVKLKDSKSDILVQLADMCTGAIARSYRDRKDKDRWRKLLAPRINDVWDFK